ncbi:MAG TPA: sigma 54 modulation/S30EA ribosomal C-terminal domain-containing protein, partial [Streptosporangiaceae bacterium]|nr:sigma 54 modulation/S30EA ribosomal C-terminal domain-containing protein [Streptosporangiaceae bacterium]
AAWDMDLMDYDFHLFTEAETGQDTVLYRGGPTGYRIAQVHPRPGWLPQSTVPVTVSRKSAARLTLPDAIEHLNATALPFRGGDRTRSAGVSALRRQLRRHRSAGLISHR